MPTNEPVRAEGILRDLMRPQLGWNANLMQLFRSSENLLTPADPTSKTVPCKLEDETTLTETARNEGVKPAETEHNTRAVLTYSLRTLAACSRRCRTRNRIHHRTLVSHDHMSVPNRCSIAKVERRTRGYGDDNRKEHKDKDQLHGICKPIRSSDPRDRSDVLVKLVSVCLKNPVLLRRKGTRAAKTCRSTRDVQRWHARRYERDKPCCTSANSTFLRQTLHACCVSGATVLVHALRVSDTHECTNARMLECTSARVHERRIVHRAVCVLSFLCPGRCMLELFSSRYPWIKIFQ